MRTAGSAKRPGIAYRRKRVSIGLPASSSGLPGHGHLFLVRSCSRGLIRRALRAHETTAAVRHLTRTARDHERLVLRGVGALVARCRERLAERVLPDTEVVSDIGARHAVP